MKLPAVLLAGACLSTCALGQSPCKPTVDFKPDGTYTVTDCSGQKHASQPAASGAAHDLQEDSKSQELYPAGNAAYDAYLKAFYEYNISALQNRREVFSWQYYSTIVIFVVVLLLVLAGVLFAALQFRHGLRRKNQNVDTVELSLGSLKVSSSTMGIIILTLSMGFFYLYLKYVYPVSIVSDHSESSSTSSSR